MNTKFIGFAEKIASLGGSAYIVGGAVRDLIMGCASHDHDIMIVGVEVPAFEQTFPSAKLTGNSFPVYRLKVEGEEVEIAFARKEEKIGTGHSGFHMVFSSNVTFEEDMVRRDTTMNALGMNIITGEVVDLFGGESDIRNGVIRAVSSHFVEDSVRVLRAARQAAQFGFSVDAETMELMRSCRAELAIEPKERIFGEMVKALATSRPSVFFRVLRECDCLSVAFPEIAELIGQTQPVEFHPEGDAFEHSMQVLDKVATMTNDVVVRFAALYHDIGKAVTPKEMLPKHYGHDRTGVGIIGNLPSCFGRRNKEVAAFVSEQHMRVHTLKKCGAIRDVMHSMRRRDITAKMVNTILDADHGSHPAWMSDDVISMVFEKVAIPSDMSRDRIGSFVREEQIRRVRAAIQNR